MNNFDTEVALDVGVNAAIIYKNIQFWCDHNEKNEKHFYEGCYWTYNSMKAFTEQFPYMSEAQVRSSLKILEEKGYIASGNFNKVAYDRTKWYADKRHCLSESEKSEDSICHGEQMDLSCITNGFVTGDEPIPDINTDVNSDKNISPIVPREKAELESMFEQFWAAYPQCFRKANKKGCKAKFLKIPNLKEIFPDILSSLEMQKRSRQWHEQNGQFIPAPLTWINQERWTVQDDRTEAQAVADDLAMNFINGMYNKG